VTTGINNSGYASWYSDTAWGRVDFRDVFTLNCKLPPGFRMGLIEFYQ
jgi:hypothetical protein